MAALIGAPNPPDETSIAWLGAVKEGLAGQGWIDGVNIRIEARFTAGNAELTARFSQELIAMRPTLVVTGTTENAVAIHSLAPATPLVFVAVPDPIAAGLVESYRRPGGIVTGVTHLEPSVAGKMVDLLVAVAPRTSILFFLTNPVTSQDHLPWRPYAVAAATTYGIQFEDAYVSALDEVEPTIARIAGSEGAGIILPSNNWVHNNAAAFVGRINALRLPAVYAAHRMVDQGGLLGIGVNIIELFKLGGDYAGRILSGTDPNDLPVRTAQFSTVVNLDTARLLGLTIPLNVLVTADRIVGG